VKSWLPRKCVVVPFDFSEKSTQSLESARAFVADLADLHVAHVVSEAFDAAHEMAWDATDHDPRYARAKSAFQDRVANSSLSEVDFQVRFGDPAREISRFADQLKADLIVMCAHGRKGLTRLVVPLSCRAGCSTNKLPGRHP
jgi:nucleotide-binding universal stress UspA family protein